MMTDWIVHHVMRTASLLGYFVALPVFIVAALLFHRRVRSGLSVSLIAGTGIATFARFIRQTPLAREYHTYTLPDGGTATGFGPNAFGLGMEIVFRASIFIMAILVVCIVLKWQKQETAQP